MLDVLSPLSPNTQREHRAAYHQFLIERDGAADFEKRTLARREAGMARFEKPLSRLREVDRQLFQEQYVAFDAKRPMSREAVLLLALVKINGAEAYAVSQVFETAQRRALRNHDEVELLLLIEEFYHTRILHSTAGLYGVEVKTPFRPMQLLRALIGGMAHAPEVIARPLLLVGEILSTVTFLNVLHAARDILKHDPELRDGIEERVTEILTDELGHLSFNRMMLGPAGMARARLILPLVVKTMANSLPELRALGLSAWSDDAMTITTSPRLPATIRNNAFIA